MDRRINNQLILFKKVPFLNISKKKLRKKPFLLVDWFLYEGNTGS